MTLTRPHRQPPGRLEVPGRISLTPAATAALATLADMTLRGCRSTARRPRPGDPGRLTPGRSRTADPGTDASRSDDPERSQPYLASCNLYLQQRFSCIVARVPPDDDHPVHSGRHRAHLAQHDRNRCRRRGPHGHPPRPRAPRRARRAVVAQGGPAARPSPPARREGRLPPSVGAAVPRTPRSGRERSYVADTGAGPRPAFASLASRKNSGARRSPGKRCPRRAPPAGAPVRLHAGHMP